jgi:ferritin-like metal-binding protein YciE
MKNIKDLEALLTYQIRNLYSSEEQILQLLPVIINKVKHRSLKNALKHHLELTKKQKSRIEEISKLLNEQRIDSGKIEILDSKYVCRGMQGVIDEANELLSEGLSEEVTDAAVIACVQKMEHYEISTYGTAVAYAVQLHHHKVELLLTETLNEEYDADDLLTALATASLNKKAAPDEIVNEDEETNSTNEEDNDTSMENKEKVSISERSIKSPGGRAGTSHRRYPTGESRGH